MLSIEQCISFLLAAFLVTAAPGPDNLMVLSIGMAKGRRAGIAFGLGCALGCLSHTLLVVVGMSALMGTSPKAIFLLQMTGGFYLVWLAYITIRRAGRAHGEVVVGNKQTPVMFFLQGVFANAINPKVILFFLSFLPQFVVPDVSSAEKQLALLGLVFTVQAALLFSVLGYFSGAVADCIARRPRIGFYMDHMAGLVFLLLGVRLLFN